MAGMDFSTPAGVLLSVTVGTPGLLEVTYVMSAGCVAWAKSVPVRGS